MSRPGSVITTNQGYDDFEALEEVASINQLPPASIPAGTTHNDTSLKVADLMAGRQRPSSIVIPSRTESLQAPELAMPTDFKAIKHRIGPSSSLQPYLKSKPVASVVSLSSIGDGDKSFELQKVDQQFTDSRGDYFNTFEKNLEKLNGGTSTTSLCIEEYLIKSEKQWHSNYKSAKLGRFSAAEKSPTTPRFFEMEVDDNGESSSASGSQADRSQAADLSIAHVVAKSDANFDHWHLGENYKPPTGIKLLMQLRIGDWPVYTIFMALGQIIASSSYQITLISGTVGQTAEKLYVVASIYLITSVGWWIMYRMMKSIYVSPLNFREHIPPSAKVVSQMHYHIALMG